jgi:hypothetical protein
LRFLITWAFPNPDTSRKMKSNLSFIKFKLKRSSPRWKLLPCFKVP